MSSHKDPIIIFIGWVAILADLATLVQFVHSKNVFDFWTLRWFISIGAILFLVSIGLSLLGLGNANEQTKFVIVIFGGIYFVAAIVLYYFWGVEQLSGRNSFGTFMGFLILFALTMGIGLWSLDTGNISFQMLSYGYAFVNIGFILLLVFKYVFDESRFKGGIFFGEILIMLIGAGVFLGLYLEDEW